MGRNDLLEKKVLLGDYYTIVRSVIPGSLKSGWGSEGALLEMVRNVRLFMILIPNLYPHVEVGLDIPPSLRLVNSLLAI